MVSIHVRSQISERLDFYACLRCGCKFVADFRRPTYDTELYGPGAIKFYVEAGAGIDQLVAPLFAFPTARGARLLDVGCGYGFTLDFARHVFGLDPIGVDPSRFAEAGREALGVPITRRYLSADLDLGAQPFALVVASEVIEHVDDPRAFIELVKAKLDESGGVIIATPDGDAVTPQTPPAELMLLLSPQLHHILFSRRALEQLLLRAGFRRVQVIRRANTLIAAAGSGSPQIDLAAPVDRRLLQLYLEQRRTSVQPDSWVAHGLGYRLLKELTNTAQYSRALDTFSELSKSISRVYGIDLEEPGSIAIAAGADEFDAFALRYPMNLAGIAYFRGLLALNHELRPDRASGYFDLAQRYGVTAGEQLARIGCADIETDEFAQRSPFLRARALAYTAPDDAVGEVSRLLANVKERRKPDSAIWRRLQENIVELFAHLVDLGALEAAERLAPVVSVLLAERWGCVRLRHVAYRALGLLSLNLRRAPQNAAAQFLLAERAVMRWQQEDPYAADAREALWRTRYERLLALVVAADARRALRAAQKFRLAQRDSSDLPSDVMREAQVLIERLDGERELAVNGTA